MSLAGRVDRSVCPTLLYELDYPRTTSIRLGYIAKTGTYMVVAFALMYVIMMQVGTRRVSQLVRVPDSLRHPNLHDLPHLPLLALRVGERTDCHRRFVIWLLLFFSVFHCLLNILAEVTMFGDRLLYEDWWNAQTMLVGEDGIDKS